MKASKPCVVCDDPKSVYACGLCARLICKNCAHSVDAETFSFHTRVPAKLKHPQYCYECFEKEVAPAKAHYEELMEKAKNVYFLTRAYPGYVHILRRHTKRVKIDSCTDRRETILRMAFLAAELGFNAVIEAEVDSFKVRKGISAKHSYQSSLWQGSALPAQVDGDQLERSSLKRI